MTASGTIAAQIGETDSRTVAYSFEDYSISASTPGGILGVTSTATVVGDPTGLAAVEHSPNIFINGSGELVVERTAAFAADFTSMYTVEAYQRTGLSSISAFIDGDADSSLFDATAGAGKVNTLAFNVPASARVGIFRISMATIGGTNENENMGSGFAVIDLENGSSSGSFMNIRTVTPDLVSWSDVPLFDDPGTVGVDERVFFTAPNTVSNRASLSQFTDGWGGTAWLDLATNVDGTRTATFNSISDVGNNSYQDYQTHGQVTWLGNEPFRVSSGTAGGTFSHGSPVLDQLGVPTGEWEVALEDIPLLQFIPDAHFTGDAFLEIELFSTGEVERVTVCVHPIADTPTLTLTNASDTNEDSTADLSGSISPALVDTDGSEVISLIDVSSVPDGFTLSDGSNSFTATVANDAVDVTSWNLSSLTLTPTADFNGTVTLDVRAQTTDTANVGGTVEVDVTEATDTDPGEGEAAGSFNVTFLPINDPPVATDDTATTDEDTLLNTTVPVATDVDGTIASYGLLGDVAEGSLTFNTDGSYSFDPTGDFDDLAPGDSRDVTFTYSATDDQGDVSGTATVTITVTGINDPPVATDDTATTDEDTLLNTNVPAATDVDGTIASYNLLGDVAEGSLTFNADGSYSFDPTGDFDDLAPSESRDVTFTYSATDDQGDVSGTATVTITVTGINDPPVATDDTATTDEDTLLNTTVPVATDVDGTIASYGLLGDVAEGSLTFNTDGSYSFDPTGDFDDLASGDSRDVSFTYTATDDQGDVSGTATVTITVTGINDSPVATDDTATTDEDTLLNTNVPAATDVDGTIASYDLLGDVVEGSLTFNADGSYSFDPTGDFDDLAPGESRDVSFTYTATDDQGDVSGTATVTITVTGINDSPVATDDTATTDEDTLLNTTVPVATDVDGTIASYNLLGDVAEGSLTFNADGSYSFDPSGDFDDLAPGESQDVTFTYSATDDQGELSATATVTITVTGLNDPPVATDDTATTDEDTLLNTNVPLATDVDGTIASYGLLGDVAEGSLTFNTDGSYSFDPTGDFDDLASGDSRDVSFTYTATDDQGDVSGTATVTITVTGINDLPVATDDTATTDEDTLLNTNVPLATDVDGTIASYGLLGDVAEGSLTFNTDGSYSFDPTGDFDDLASGDSRDVSFTYTATDDQGDVSGTATVTITVTGINDLPVATDDTATTDEDTLLNTTVPVATDVDGTIASYGLLGDVAEGSLTFNTDGSYSFDPTGDFDDLASGDSRDVSFTYTATDDQGDVSGTATVTITVTGINDLPVATDDTATTDEDTLLNTNVPAATDVDGTIASYNLLGRCGRGQSDVERRWQLQL